MPNSSNGMAAVEGHHDGREDVQDRGADGLALARAALSANDDPCTDVFHSEVQA